MSFFSILDLCVAIVQYFRRLTFDRRNPGGTRRQRRGNPINRSEKKKENTKNKYEKKDLKKKERKER